MIARPPVTMQAIESPFRGDRGGRQVEVNAFSLTPLLDYLRGRVEKPSLTADPAPDMFSTGPLPLFTASGVEVDVLRRIHWRIRHSAAVTPDRSLVLAMVEAGADGDTERAFYTVPGEEQWQRYASDTWRWATAPSPVENSPVTSEEEQAFWAGRVL